jgi:hypothetical protein
MLPFAFVTINEMIEFPWNSLIGQIRTATSLEGKANYPEYIEWGDLGHFVRVTLNFFATHACKESHNSTNELTRRYSKKQPKQ